MMFDTFPFPYQTIISPGCGGTLEKTFDKHLSSTDVTADDGGEDDEDNFWWNIKSAETHLHLG